jgi:hypothetical protein
VASGTRPEEVDLSADGAPRTAADRARSPGSPRPLRQGESALGIPADSRGAPQARDHPACERLGHAAQIRAVGTAPSQWRERSAGWVPQAGFAAGAFGLFVRAQWVRSRRGRTGWNTEGSEARG